MKINNKIMDKYVLETDGSYSHDIDVGGIGGVLYKNGQIIDVYSLAFKNVKNEHESLSILYGLMLAKKHGAQDLTVKTDSLHHVSLFKSNYQVYINKQTQENYKTQSLKIAQSLESFTICFQKREDNRTADKLSTLYKNNGYISISAPIEDLGMLPHDLFLSNKNHTSGDFRGITMFDISFFSQNKSTQKIFLNTIHYDKETNQFEIKTQEAVNDLGKISTMIYENLKITPGHSMVVNGQSANIIRQTLAKSKGVTKNLHAAFLYLSENLSKSAVVVNSYKKNKYKPFKINKEDNASEQEGITKAPKPVQPKVYTTPQTVQTSPDAMQPSDYHVYIKTGSVIVSNNKVKYKNIICEAYYINKKTQEVFYCHDTQQYSPDGCIALLNKLLKKEGYHYTLDLEGEFLPALMSSYANNLASSAIKEKFKKLEGIDVTLSNDVEQNSQYKDYALNRLTNTDNTVDNSKIVSAIKPVELIKDTISSMRSEASGIEQAMSEKRLT